MTWHAVDSAGLALATGRPPAGPGHATPAAALTGAPVVTWPLAAVDGQGQRLRLGVALGAGGDRVEHLLAALAGGRLRVSGAELEALARATPAGGIVLPLAVVGLATAAGASARIEPSFLAEVEQQRADLRQAVVAQGREPDLEAALHVTMLLATERLAPVGPTGADGLVGSGARLWLLTAAVVSALAGWAPDPFAAWGWLIAAGYWPVGPSDGYLVVGDARPRRGQPGP
ncbi:MAG: hypothetical protein ACRD0N_01385 [Acidimicrobiales bacterium]